MLLAKENNKFIVGSFFITAILTLASYSNIYTHTFLHWDDISYVLNNENLRSLTPRKLLNIFSEFSSDNWHPVTWLTYAANFSLFGESAFLFKATNLFIHLLNSVLLFYLAYLLLFIAKHPHVIVIESPFKSGDRDIIISSLACAFFFALHPQHVESVTWVSGRKDLLCTFFYISALIGYIHMHFSARKLRWSNIVLACYVLSLMSKSMAVTFPVILVLLDIYPLRKTKNAKTITDYFNSLLRDKVLYIFLSTAVITITFITQAPNIASGEGQNLFIRISHAATNYFYYIYSILFPNTITPYHPSVATSNELTIRVIAPVLLFALLFFGLYFLYKKNYKLPVLVFGAYLVMLLPAIGLVHIGHAARADRYAYLPTIVFYILIGIAISYLWKNVCNSTWLKYSFYGGLSALSISCAIVTYHYNKVWANDKTVWSHVIIKYPDTAATAYSNLGNVYFEESNHPKAIELYKKAVQINPKYFDALKNLGYSYEKLNEFENAEKYYKKMIEVDPSSYFPYTVVGDFYFRHNKYPDAHYNYLRALSINPTSEIALLRCGLLDYMKGDVEESEKKIDRLLLLKPNNLDARQLKERIHRLKNNPGNTHDISK